VIFAVAVDEKPRSKALAAEKPKRLVTFAELKLPHEPKSLGLLGHNQLAAQLDFVLLK
jgi:hypothetical protein